MDILIFLNDVIRTLPGVAVVIFYVVVLWWVFELMTPFNDREELFRKNNLAYLLQRLGLVAGQVIAMLAVIPDFDVNHPWESAGWLLLEGLWVAIALVTARWFIDWVILRKTKNQELLLKGNLGVGIAEAGAYVGIGLLLGGSLTGTAETAWLSLATTVIFYLLGLLFVVAVFWLYELATPYHLRHNLEEGSVSAGIELAGVFVAACVAVQVGVAGDFESWGSDLGWFFVTALIAVLLLGIIWGVSLLLERAFWHVTQEQRKQTPTVTVATLRAGMMILAGVVTATVLNLT